MFWQGGLCSSLAASCRASPASHVPSRNRAGQLRRTVTDRKGQFPDRPRPATTSRSSKTASRRQSQLLRARRRPRDAGRSCTSACCSTPAAAWTPTSSCRARRAIKFLNTLTDAKDITLVDFDTEVRVTKFSQQDFPRLVERIRARKPGASRRMYDALGVYLDGADRLDGPEDSGLFTDGGDTRSTIRFGDVLTLIRASDVTVYSDRVPREPAEQRRADQRLRLTQLADRERRRGVLPVDDETDRRGLRQDPRRRFARSTSSATSRRIPPPMAAGGRSRSTCARPDSRISRAVAQGILRAVQSWRR